MKASMKFRDIAIVGALMIGAPVIALAEVAIDVEERIRTRSAPPATASREEAMDR